MCNKLDVAMAIALYFFNNYSSNLSFRNNRSIKKMNLALIGGKHEIHGVAKPPPKCAIKTNFAFSKLGRKSEVADQINLIMRMT